MSPAGPAPMTSTGRPLVGARRSIPWTRTRAARRGRRSRGRATRRRGRRAARARQRIGHARRRGGRRRRACWGRGAPGRAGSSDIGRSRGAARPRRDRPRGAMPTSAPDRLDVSRDLVPEDDPRAAAKRPSTIFASVPQIPTARRAQRTSPGPGSRTATVSSRTSPGPWNCTPRDPGRGAPPRSVTRSRSRVIARC